MGLGRAFQQTWADGAALSIWQEKGDGTCIGVMLAVPRQRHQSFSLTHVGKL